MNGRRTRRFLHILRVLLVHGLAYTVVRMAGSRQWLLDRTALTSLTPARRFRRLFEDLGGSFVKFGQMLALQPDIVSLEYCDELFNLLDRLPPFPADAVERIFIEELGRPPGDLFDRFDPTPLATASIGQVHRAVLRGRAVAVKVQRPEADVDFDGDIRLMEAGARLIRRFRIGALEWLLEPMGEFTAWTREELDFRREARYTERLRRNAAETPTERVPEVCWDLTTRRVLVVEFLEGTTVLDYLRAVASGDETTPFRLAGQGFAPARFARHIIDNFLGDAFRFGVFHADLHPANLLILRDNVVGYVDFGITGVLSRYSRRHLVTLTLAYTRGDIGSMTDAFFRVTIPRPDADHGRFRAGMLELAKGWFDARGDVVVMRCNFTRVMLDMLALSHETNVWPERDVIKYIRSAIAADGLITRFAPEFSLSAHLGAVCQRWVTWEAQQAALASDTVTAAASAGMRLATHGAQRAAILLRRLTDGEPLVRVRVSTPERPGDRPRRRVVRAAGVTAAALAMVELAPRTGGLGANVYTATVCVASGALVLLAVSLRRLGAA